MAGSNASDSTEIYAEGLRIAPMKLYDAGKLNKTIMTFIEKNVRLPVQVQGDLRAQLAACHIAETQFADLVSKHGPAQTKKLMAEVLDHAERLTRAELAKLPDGEWTFEDFIDDDGIDYGKPIRLFVTIRKSGELDGNRLDRHEPAGERRDQQYALLHQSGFVLRSALRASAEHPEQ